MTRGPTRLDVTVNYAAPGRGVLVARGRALRVGRSIATAEAIVTDASDGLVRMRRDAQVSAENGFAPVQPGGDPDEDEAIPRTLAAFLASENVITRG